MKKVFIGMSAAILLGLISYAFLYSNDLEGRVSNPRADTSVLNTSSSQKTQESAEQNVAIISGPVDVAHVDTRDHRNTQSPTTDVTPSEGRLLSGAALSIDAAEHILGSDKYGEFIQEFANETAVNSDALDLTRLYLKGAEELLVTDGARLISLHCGTTLCAGQIRSNSLDTYNTWATAFSENEATPHYSFIDRSINVGTHDYEHRFIFSTDPAANSVTVPLYSVPKK